MKLKNIRHLLNLVEMADEMEYPLWRLPLDDAVEYYSSEVARDKIQRSLHRATHFHSDIWAFLKYGEDGQ